MSEVLFDWDERKAQTNEQKHGVSFEEAQTVFYDPNARCIYDPDHSRDEDRYIMLGLSESLRLLVVCHVYQDQEVIRIISARKVNKSEAQQYQSFSQ
jgi:uncharacterized protein